MNAPRPTAANPEGGRTPPPLALCVSTWRTPSPHVQGERKALRRKRFPAHAELVEA